MRDLTRCSAMAAAVVLTLAVGALDANATEIGDVSKEEFFAASYYEQALADDRIKKIKQENARINKIAKSIKLSSKKLRAAIDKVGGLDGDPTKLATAAINDGFKGSRVEGRVITVLINASEPKHVVAYVRFHAKKAPDVVKDASTIAHIVASKTPFVSTVSLSAVHPAAPRDSRKSMWGAKISVDRAVNIRPDRIEDYADRLYKRLFEVVDPATQPQ